MMWDIEITNETEEDLSLYEGLIKAIFAESLNFSQRQLPKEGEVSITIVSNAEMQLINHEHRGKDSTTDVLSFPQYEAYELENLKYAMLGDIIISIDKARTQAKEYGHSIERELAFLTTHGALHLLGYDHQTSEDEKTMFALQDEILDKQGLSRLSF